MVSHAVKETSRVKTRRKTWRSWWSLMGAVLWRRWRGQNGREGGSADEGGRKGGKSRKQLCGITKGFPLLQFLTF